MEGCLRNNIDLREDYTDEQIATVLKRTGLWECSIFDLEENANNEV